MKKLTLVVGLAAGYVLGSRAGRERYEQIKAGASRLARHPAVEPPADEARRTASVRPAP